MDFTSGWEAVGHPGSGMGAWLLLFLGLVFLLVVVPLLVFVCLRDSPWEEEPVPAVRWMNNRRVRAFASAAAAGDFKQAELWARAILGSEPDANPVDP